jgi:predicted Zn-dependent protease
MRRERRDRPAIVLAAVALAAAALAAALLAGGCGSVRSIGTQLGQGSGMISEEQARSINRAGEALEKTFEDITPEQEYYLGRAVAATILRDYPPLDDQEANLYVNRVGQTLAMASDRPETFGGYHFLVLDSDEINAFAAPGGLILVTRGMLACCGSEDELAAVLAHEIAHVQHKDGLRAIKKSRLTAALTTLSLEAARNLGGEDLRELTEQFEGSIGDITQTLVNSGYARSQEHAADRAALAILVRVGYDPAALLRMLEAMGRRWEPHGPGFARTHPGPGDRVAGIGGEVPAAAPADVPAARRERFAAALGGV